MEESNPGPRGPPIVLWGTNKIVLITQHHFIRFRVKPKNKAAGAESALLWLLLSTSLVRKRCSCPRHFFEKCVTNWLQLLESARETSKVAGSLSFEAAALATLFRTELLKGMRLQYGFRIRLVFACDGVGVVIWPYIENKKSKSSADLWARRKNQKVSIFFLLLAVMI